MSVNLTLVTGPVIEPVPLAMMKAFLAVDAGYTADDAMITALISAARVYAEHYCNRAFFNQTWLLSLDYFPFFSGAQTIPSSSDAAGLWTWKYYWSGVQFKCPKPSLVSVTSITYLDATATLQTVPPSTYFLDRSSEPGRIVPSLGSYWPWTDSYFPGGVKITYVAGSYGDGVTINTIPQTLCTAIQLLVAGWYANRESTSANNISQVPFGVNVLLDTVKFTYWSWDNN